MPYAAVVAVVGEDVAERARALTTAMLARATRSRPSAASHLVDRAAEHELAATCQQFGLSLVPFAPLHGGLLAGLDVLDSEVQGDRRFGGAGFSDAEVAVAREVERLSRDWGLRPAQVALAWLLSRPAVASAIVGAETVEE